jgi:DNA-directed RNA polymerase subunit N (RpoN/RPB10)
MRRSAYAGSRPIPKRRQHEISHLCPECAPAIERRVRARYADQVHALNELGFDELCCYSELLGDYSLLLSLPTVIFMQIRREVLYWRPPLQAAASFLLLRHRDPETIALPLGLGVKLYTGYSDGTLVVTANFVSMAVPRANTGVRKQSEDMSIETAWRRHQERVATFTTNGTILSADSFAVYVRMSRQEDASLQPRPPAR